jgi:signal transduction histidine kinase
VLLALALPRDIYAQGQNSLAYFLVALMVICVTLILVSNVFAERLILRRLGMLSRTVSHVRASGDLSTQVTITGQDELGQLGENFNQMMAEIQDYQHTLATARDQLEQRVQERTAELEQANARLRQEVAEREQTQRELAQTRDQALDALRLKTRILANVSHDARTPLNVITLRSETLKREYFGPLNAKQHEILDSIMASARSLLGFVNNLLQEAQLQTGTNQHLKQIPFHPAALLDEVRDALLPLAERKGLTLEGQIDARMQIPLVGDPEGLKQILFNLVENAIKFTAQGGITVRLFDVDAGHWGMKVADTGCGIPKEAHDRVFDAFWQVDGSITRENQGVGLGLSIVRQLVTLMNADITLQSEVGRGTTFTIAFPRIEPEVLEGQGE